MNSQTGSEVNLRKQAWTTDLGWKLRTPTSIPVRIPLTNRLSLNFDKKRSRLLIAIEEDGEWLSRLEPQPGALRALREMRSRGVDVRIVIDNLSHVKEKMAWINTNIPHEDWWKRVLICPDKTLLAGTFLIDSDPVPTLSGNSLPTWQHVLYANPYNEGTFSWPSWRTANIVPLTATVATHLTAGVATHLRPDLSAWQPRQPGRG